ncbi:sulfotransferase [Mycobacterium sp.]|uniref:sulfotransferase family protein n=1 Tax=Mycobacterium sp. TaxID=1785 RepID=UPI002BA56655|nr:sulfotransferase [Mycobacterium sp.]HTY32549.1 sulfotransferase [Mycobacterium sp.]
MTEVATPLLVLGAGQRCGSTLVQRLLCSHPDVMIWGEHAGQLRPVLAAVEQLRLWTGHHGAKARDEWAASDYQGFIANLTPERARIDDAGRAFIETLFAEPAHRNGRPIWGFKEVRYGLPDIQPLLTLFPRLRVIHIVRDPRDVLCSLEDWERHPGWTRRDTETSVGCWRTVAESFIGSEEDSSLRRLILTVRYEDLIADTRRWSAAIAEHCELDAHQFDHAVFDRRVHDTRGYGPLDRELHTWSQLPASLRALADKDVAMVASAYGYDLT